MTEDQKDYTKKIESSRSDLSLELVSSSLGSNEQSFLSANDGFLAHGRRLVPTRFNRISLRFPGRCTNFGSDAMVGMLDWLGHEVAHRYSEKKYEGVHLMVGDMAAPRGGCLWGHHGRTPHRSHKNGADADIGYLTVKSHQKSPLEFHTQFDPASNWWLLKKVFKNPYACIRLVLLDQKNIQKLARVAQSDSEWKVIRRYLQHAKGHHNHFHVRIGSSGGTGGCIRGNSQLARLSEVPLSDVAFDRFLASFSDEEAEDEFEF